MSLSRCCICCTASISLFRVAAFSTVACLLLHGADRKNKEEMRALGAVDLIQAFLDSPDGTERTRKLATHALENIRGRAVRQ